MNTNGLGLAFGIGTVFLIIFVYSWWNSDVERTKRALKSAAVRPIGSLRDGELVRVQGTLRCLEGAPLVSPLGQRKCAVCTTYVSVKKGKSYKTLVDERQGRTFLIQDGTGSARVELQDYRIAIHQDLHLSSGTFDDPPAHVVEFLDGRGLKHTGFLDMNLTMNYREGVLEPGETVTVLGRVRFENIEDSGQSSGYRDRPRRAVIVSPANTPMLISDEVSVTRSASAV